MDQPASNRLIIGILLIAAFVVILNETTLAVALPTLIHEFHVSASTAQWLTSGFMLTMAVIIPSTGYLLQRFSMRRLYVIALGIFLAGTLLAAAAPTFPVLLAARIIQATGTALVVPLLMTAIMQRIPVERRGTVFGLVGVVLSVAPALGPTFSGVVIQFLSWRWVFLLIAPLVLGALLVGARLITVAHTPTNATLDIPSLLLSAAALSATLMGLSGVADAASGIPTGRLLVLLAGLVLLGVFCRRQVRRQRQGLDPLLNLSPFASKGFRRSLILLLAAVMMLFGYIILMPIMAQQVMGLSQSTTGLVSLPGGLVMAAMAPFVGRWYDRIGPRPLIVPGAVVLTLTMWGFVALTPQAHTWNLVVLSITLNVGIELMFTPLMAHALAAVPTAIASHGQAIVNTLQQVASSIGTALFVAVMSFAATRAMGASGAGPEVVADAVAVEHGLSVAFGVGGVLGVAMLLAALLLRLSDSPRGA